VIDVNDDDDYGDHPLWLGLVLVAIVATGLAWVLTL